MLENTIENTLYKESTIRRIIKFGFVCVSLVLATQVIAESVFDYPRDPEFVIIEFTQVEEMLDDADPTPLLRIYGDGRVLVHYPAYMKRAGDYEMQLSDANLQQLLLSLEQKSIFRLNSERVAQLKQQAAMRRFAQSKTVTQRSDDIHSIVKIKLGTYVSATTGVTQTNFNKRVSLKNLRWNAKKFPEVAELKKAAEAELELTSLLNHPDLKKIN